MQKKYCFIPCSLKILGKISSLYGGFTFNSISDLEINSSVFEDTQKNSVDMIYIFSQLLVSSEEFGSIFSGNIYITSKGVYGVNETGDFIRIEENSRLYIFRFGNISKSFYQFLKLVSKKYWNIDVIFSYEGTASNILSSKVHGMYYYDSLVDYPESIVPGIISEEDSLLLARFIKSSGLFTEKIIVKKDGFFGGEGIEIFSIKDSIFDIKFQSFIKDQISKDYIIMTLIDTTDIEYRVYWVRDDSDISILEIHGKMRKKGQILHNIAQGNSLVRIDKNQLSEGLFLQIKSFVRKLPALHGGLDVLMGLNGKYYITENNAMVGYLCEEEEKHFLKDWLNLIAEYYKS